MISEKLLSLNADTLRNNILAHLNAIGEINDRDDVELTFVSNNVDMLNGMSNIPIKLKIKKAKEVIITKNYG